MILKSSDRRFRWHAIRSVSGRGRKFRPEAGAAGRPSGRPLDRGRDPKRDVHERLGPAKARAPAPVRLPDPVAGAPGIDVHEAGVAADAAEPRPARSSGKARGRNPRDGDVRRLRLKVQRVPRGGNSRAAQHLVGLRCPEPGVYQYLALVALQDREMPDAGQKPQQRRINWHRAALAPVAHEPLQATRFDRVRPAPPLEPGGQDLPGACVTQPEERLRGGPRRAGGLRKRGRAGQDTRGGAQDEGSASHRLPRVRGPPSGTCLTRGNPADSSKPRAGTVCRPSPAHTDMAWIGASPIIPVSRILAPQPAAAGTTVAVQSCIWRVLLCDFHVFFINEKACCGGAHRLAAAPLPRHHHPPRQPLVAKAPESVTHDRAGQERGMTGRASPRVARRTQETKRQEAADTRSNIQGRRTFRHASLHGCDVESHNHDHPLRLDARGMKWGTCRCSGPEFESGQDCTTDRDHDATENDFRPSIGLREFVEGGLRRTRNPGQSSAAYRNRPESMPNATSSGVGPSMDLRTFALGASAMSRSPKVDRMRP